MTFDRKALLARVQRGELSVDAALQAMRAQPPRPAELESNPSSKEARSRAALIRGPGDLDDLELALRDVPEPADDELQIAVRACSLNFGDWLCLAGLYPNMPPYPFVPGSEVAGVVRRVGRSVHEFGVGDEVIALQGAAMGGHAEVVNAPARLAVRKPVNVSFEQAAAFPVVFMTAAYALDRAGLVAGERILIQSAAGGTGLVAVQLAQQAGAQIIATAGSREKLDYLERLGVRELINYRTEPFAERVRTLTQGRGVDVVFNSLSGDAIQKGIDLLSPGGRYVEIALAGLRAAPQLDLSNLVNNQSFISVHLGWLINSRPQEIRAYLARMADELEHGTVRPTVARVFEFEQLREAYRHLKERQAIGKVVLRVSEPASVQRGPVAVARPTAVDSTPESRVEAGPRAESDGVSEPIAIIGISGRFPDAPTVQALWKNLANGHSSIREVPSQRWDASLHYDPDPRAQGRSYGKWGAYLDDIDAFDPLFFSISPQEAELMDPQQRIFLEEAWKALEDAGQSDQRLAGRRCGVFVGVGVSDYQKRVEASGAQPNAYSLMGNSPAILASRIAYHLNLKGPAVAVDTACSSSLVALHLACQSLRDGDSELALVGGVFAIVTPDFHILASKAGMLSPRGRCSTFDQGADGFVPGEGAGVVVLKRLSRALSDGDRVYAVIRATAINQDGKTNGITAPSARSQTELELEAYRRAGISPETLSYVEAHGTGTKLGDPIEIQALTDAFRQFTPRKGFCGIGSLKTNLGHTVTAAGIASLIKVILSLRERQLPPSLHFTTSNEHIDFENSPFYVTTSLRPWQTRDGVPRRAAVSSFGFSGTNCHVVLEESEPAPLPATPAINELQLVTLSAKSPEALRTRLSELASWIEQHGATLRLEDVATSANRGRSHFEWRQAFIVTDLRDLCAQLRTAEQALAESAPSVARTRKPDSPEQLRRVSEACVAKFRAAPHGDASRTEALTELSHAYERGAKVDWEAFYEGSAGRLLSLPGYPFARERYWTSPAATAIALEPILDSRVPGTGAPRFAKKLMASNWLLEQHVISGRHILPGVVYLELARAAGDRLSSDRRVRALRNVTWSAPVLSQGQSVDLQVELDPESDESARFRVCTLRGEGPTVHAQGRLVLGGKVHAEANRTVDLSTLRARCPERLERSAVYARFKAIGVEHGPRFQVIEEAFVGEHDALTRLTLPPDASEAFGLHPALLDGVLQSIIGISSIYGSGVESAAASPEATLIPFSLEELDIFGPLPRTAWAHAALRPGRIGNGASFDLCLIDDQGRLLMQFRGFEARPAKLLRPTARAEAASDVTTFFSPVWQASELPPTSSAASLSNRSCTLVFGTPSNQPESHADSLFVQPGAGFRRLNSQLFEINPQVAGDYQRLLSTLTADGRSFDSILHAWHAGAGAQSGSLPSGLESVMLLARALSARPAVPLHFVYAHAASWGVVHPEHAAVGAFLQSWAKEAASLSAKLVSVPPSLAASPSLELLNRELSTAFESRTEEVAYSDEGRRHVRRYREVTGHSRGRSELKPHGVYLITGGLGGVGRVFARYLGERYQARVVLAGRTAPAPGCLEGLTAPNSDAAISYVRADVTLAEDVDALLRTIRQRHGALSGIFHCAGVVDDAFFARKSPEALERVLAPKMRGAKHLDLATRAEALDLFVLFSSLSSVFGQPGQTDYAAANRFLDAFSAEREALRSRGERAGRTLSINWGPWRTEPGTTAGMAIPESFAQWSAAVGLAPIAGDLGGAALECALVLAAEQELAQVVALHGQRERLVAGFRRAGLLATPAPGQEPSAAPPSEQLASSASVDASALQLRVGRELLELAASTLKLDATRISPEAALSNYGFDSITFTELANRVNTRFGIEITPAFFFEHGTLGAVARQLAEGHAEALAQALGLHAATATSSPRPEPRPEAPVPNPANLSASATPTPEWDPIAVVGLAGVFPESEDIDQLWEHLRAGRDLIREIPAERFDWREYFGDPRTEGGNKTYSRWGGFVPRVDAFDASFFRISPREAQLMDPQQRLFLQVVWRTLEDAGHAPSALAGRKIGLFVGVATGDYSELLIREDHEIEAHTSTGNAHSMLPNRISYLMDWHGPSEPVDTACSSSLVAVHRAVQAIRNGDCEAAIVGGVNVLLSPTMFVSFSKAGMLSRDGRCKTFDRRADGYVRGEGAGAALLKPLSRAVADGDHIYGLILGSAVNHGGHTSSLTAPNPVAQAALLTEAYRRAGIAADTVGYIEAHGTGTELGDPIEVRGLRKSLSNGRRQTCGVGSIKSNLGHLETAAGIAGLVKVLLSFRHRTIPASLHVQELNPYLELIDSPLYVVSRTERWERLRDDSGNELPRRAGVSSFGFGGANAHVVLQEAPEERRPQPEPASAELVVLSAKTRERLTVYAERLAHHLEANPESSLADVAHTLRVGRDAMDHRLALVVTSTAELVARLRRFALGSDVGDGVWVGDVSESVAAAKLLRVEDVEDRAYLEALAQARRLDKLARLWVAGANLPWSSLPEQRVLRRVRLPAYPFATPSYWLPPRAQAVSAKRAARLHPLLDVNETNLDQFLFRRRFTPDEPLVAAHVVRGRRVLPAVAQLEMARAAGEQLLRAPVTALQDVYWLQPIVVDEPIDVLTEITVGEHHLSFEISSEGAAGRVLHSTGRLHAQPLTARAEWSDIETVRSRCSLGRRGADVYARDHDVGLDLGAYYRTLSDVHANDEEAVGRIARAADSAHAEGCVLDPGVLDGLLHVAMGLAIGAADQRELQLPYYLGALEIHGPLSPVLLARATVSAVGKDARFDYEVVADGDDPSGSKRTPGSVRLVIRTLLTRPLPAAPVVREPEVVSCVPVWRPAVLELNATSAAAVLLIGGDETRARALAEALQSRNPEAQCIHVCAGPRFANPEPGRFELRLDDHDDVNQLWQTLDAGGTRVARVVHWLATDEAVSPGFFLALARAHSQVRGDRPLRVLHVFRPSGRVDDAKSQSLAGFARVWQLEAGVALCVLAIDPEESDSHASRRVVDELEAADVAVEVRWKLGERQVRTFEDLALQTVPPLQLRADGVYVITGGRGALGRVFSNYLVTRGARHVAWIGRARKPTDIEADIETFGRQGVELTYWSAAVEQHDELAQALAAIRRSGSIRGILHAAGLLDDALLREQAPAAFASVLAPKVEGTLALDALTAGDDLDWFVLFSSVVGVLGNMGQASYATANRYLDALAEWREGERRAGRRKGKSLTINWPLWAADGMAPSASDQSTLMRRGVAPLPTEIGVSLFERALSWASSAETHQVLFAFGDRERLRSWHTEQTAETRAPQSVASDSASAGELDPLVTRRLRELIGTLLKIAPSEVDARQPFGEYGFDSIFMAELMSKVNDGYRLSLTPADLFEHNTLERFARHLTKMHPTELRRAHAREMGAEAPRSADAPVARGTTRRRALTESPPAAPNSQHASAARPRSGGAVGSSEHREAIAIVGVAGIFPESEDVDAFWGHLEQERDLIREIPSSRFDWRAHYGEGEGKNRIRSRWGGFMPGIEAFDAGFFRISPREARLMDPQQRKFLEVVWKAVEDAGYASQELSGQRIGLFVGVAGSDYTELSLQPDVEIEAYMSTGNAHSVLPNRVSYLMDWRGPSEPVDTACSSSLVAVHRACQAILSGDCDAAVAGGVNALLTPTMFVSFSKAGMLSKDGRCRAFDKGADGYVRGEGVGAIVLKRLSRALADGDTIRGVILGSAVNHGGHASSLTAPNPTAQAEVLEEAYRRAGIGIETVSYLEAHGTGTTLGDPVEVNGLKKAFGSGKEGSRQQCGLGTVKSNIGHLETAAGIAGLVKVLQSFRHGKLPASLHLTELNPYIDVVDSPFYVVSRTQRWERLKDESGGAIPRRAGVSSFGFGGANAHVVLEEAAEQPRAVAAVQGEVLLLLSAKSVERLSVYAERLASHLEQHPEQALSDVAYTLQVGRDAMDHRVAILSDDRTRMVEQLRRFAQLVPGAGAGTEPMKGVWVGRRVLSAPTSVTDLPDNPPDHADAVWSRLAESWASGAEVDWKRLHPPETRRRVPLPSYPFEREEYWVPRADRAVGDWHSILQELSLGRVTLDEATRLISLESIEQGA